MRTLNGLEMEQVSGGDWSFGFDFRVVNGEVSGPESIQEIVSGAVDAVSSAYGGAVDAMANFFTWWDPAGYYSSGC